MKRLVFLPESISWGMVIFLVFAFLKLSFVWFLFSLMIFTGIFFFFRRSMVSYSETIKTDGEIFLSPIYGKVMSVRLNVPVPESQSYGHEIRISMSMLDPKGIYLPTAAEVNYLKATKGKKIPRNSDLKAFYGPMDEVAHTDLTLASKENNKTTMRFVDAPYSQRPTVWLKYGDRGRGAACFGFYPCGGTLFIYLPKNSDILVYESERVIPGQSVLAAIKDVN